MLAQVADSHLLIAITIFSQQLRMPHNHPGDLPEIRVDTAAAAGERIPDIRKKPRTPLASPPDSYTVTPGLAGHGNGIFCSPDIAVPYNRY